jgi:hypothetical protein
MGSNKYSITPLAVKFELHAYGEVYDVSNDLQNWKEIEVILKRYKNSGVFDEVSFPFEFVLDGYDIIKDIFDTHQYRAVGDMYIYLRRDDWAYNSEKYYEPQIYNLDFTSYKKSDTTIEINTSRSSLCDFLRARGKVDYDIPVAEIKENKPWRFNRIDLENKIMLRCTTEYAPLVWNYRGLKTIGSSVETTEVAVQDIVYSNTIAPNISVPSGNSHAEYYFAYLSEKAEGRNLRFEMELRGIATYLPTERARVSICLYKELGTDSTLLREYVIGNGNKAVIDKGIFWNQYFNEFTEPGAGYYLVINFDSSSTINIDKISIDGTMAIRYNAQNAPVDINVIHPKTLFQRLVDRVTETSGVYLSDIEDFNTSNQDLIMMAAAESIRGIEPTSESDGAKVHTSYNKFLEWMNVFGYEEHVSKTSVILKKRAMSFRSDLTAIELEIDECADLREYINEDILYSGVKIGYERKDIENANVRFEFNGLQDYSTDLILQKNIVELISPYRADCYGIEFLAQERGKDTTDTKNDKDLFLVNLQEGNSTYKTVESQFSGNALVNIDGTVNNTLFNGALNPYNLLLRNLDLIGVSVKNLKFTGSDSNAEIIIDGTPINSNVNIPDGTGLYDPIIYDIASRNLRRPPEGESMNGLVKFKYLVKSKMETKVVTFEGFIDEIGHYPTWEMDTTWTLRKRKK